jgi:hypothetical protein
LKAIVLSNSKPQKVNLFWRPLGNKNFTSIPFKHIDRRVFEVRVESKIFKREDFEYYILSESGSETTRFPVEGTNSIVIEE